jgi:hypothetical protein
VALPIEKPYEGTGKVIPGVETKGVKYQTFVVEKELDVKTTDMIMKRCKKVKLYNKTLVTIIRKTVQ